MNKLDHVDVELTTALRGALAHLDDPLYLESHALAKCLDFVAQSPEIPHGQLLRRILRLAIEGLDPGPGVPPTAREARRYQILHRYAISKQSIVSIALQLNMSERQAYRDLRRGVEALAEILVQSDLDGGAQGEQAERKEGRPWMSLRDEVERISTAGYQEVDVVKLIEDVVESARHLARTKDIDIRLLPESAQLRLVVNRVMLRQAFLNLLSHVVRVHQGNHIEVQLSTSEGAANLRVIYYPQTHPDIVQSESPLAVAGEIFGSLGIYWARSTRANGTSEITVCIRTAQQKSVLIIDDNEDMIALFRRYLSHQPYRVYGVTNADEALKMLDRLHLDIVVLDIMMPTRDGWEILQMMRSRRAGPRLAVIVCSIIDDSQLSAALGADGFLHKPVTRGQLLAALARATAFTHS